MRYRPLGNTGMLVSEVALGTAALGLDYGFRNSSHYAAPSEREVHRILHRAVECGINLFDTARSYGEAETRIGQVLGELRPRPLVATKFSATDHAGIQESVESSLRALRTETIDVLQIHNATKELLGNGELLDTLEELKEQGKIRFAGASVYEADDAMTASACLPLVTLQVPFNLLDQSMTPVFRAAGERRRVGIMVRSAFLRGVLTERIHEVPEQLAPLRDRALAMLKARDEPVVRLPELALRFCLSQEAVSTVLLGVRAESELMANVAAADLGPLAMGILESDDALIAMTKPTNWTGLI
jgi:aryl-alcohol dehydrogenase-like predicted oxidoreductase